MDFTVGYFFDSTELIAEITAAVPEPSLTVGILALGIIAIGTAFTSKA